MTATGKVHVYFIKPVGMAGPIKIGASNCPVRRLLDLSFWSPVKLELIGAVRGSVKDEFFLHRCFADTHSHHEWFDATPRLWGAIDGILKFGIEYARSNLEERGQIRKRRRVFKPKIVAFSKGKLRADDFLARTK